MNTVEHQEHELLHDDESTDALRALEYIMDTGISDLARTRDEVDASQPPNSEGSFATGRVSSEEATRNVCPLPASTKCNICEEKYSKRLRAPISCQYCQYEACSQCCQTYILSETEPKCMNTECNRVWTRKYMSTVFSATFLSTKWKTHRENVIFDQERALLPATQPLVENIIRRERITTEIHDINAQINTLYNRRDVLRAEYHGNPINTIEPERRTFIRACPDPECRGFLSTQWKCGICEKWTCPACNEIKGTERDAEHTCNPELVETVALIRQDTKPCPNCGMGIFKINGCDQMFCTQCHTAFCWRTGHIQTAIHNPHYFEWLRENNGNDNANIERNPQDVICGREIDTYFVRNLNINIQRKMTAETAVQGQRVIAICRTMIHIRRVDMVYYQVNHVLNNQNLRIKYLRNQISEEQLKINLQKNDKKHQKHREIFDILQMVNTTTTDILYRFLEEIRKNTWNNDFTIIQEIDQLRLYANRCLHEISETYKSIRMRFNDKMEFTKSFVS
jgi:hypothetical protein